MVKLACVNIDKLYRFNKILTEGQALKFLKNCRYSPHIRVVGYKSDSPYDTSDLEIAYGQQVQDIMPYIFIIKELPLYEKTKKTY